MVAGVITNTTHDSVIDCSHVDTIVDGTGTRTTCSISERCNSGVILLSSIIFSFALTIISIFIQLAVNH